jgi:hypothetical protein
LWFFESDVWDRLDFYDRTDFSFPDKLKHDVLLGLDRLAERIGRAVILSDYREKSDVVESQHRLGRAIDFTYPARDPGYVLEAIRDTKAFSGIGMYLNSKGAVSFHVDTRTDRPPDNPAIWGALKAAAGWRYMALDTVREMLRDGGGIKTLALLAGVIVSLSLLFPSKS